MWLLVTPVVEGGCRLMSDHAKLLTFRDTAPSLSQVMAVLTASRMSLESGERVHLILPSLTDKPFQKWRYAVRSLCKQWEARIIDGTAMLSMHKREDGRHVCLYEAELDIQK
jgi:hypothetical protein